MYCTNVAADIAFVSQKQHNRISLTLQFLFVWQESKKDEESVKTWPYFLDMDRVLSSQGEMATQ